MKQLIICIILLTFTPKLFGQAKPLINSRDIIEGEMASFRVEPVSTKTLVDQYHWLIKKDEGGRVSTYYENKTTQRLYSRTWNDTGNYTVYVRMRDKNGCLSPQIPMDFTVHPSRWYIKPMPINRIQCSLTPDRLAIGTTTIVTRSFDPISFKVAFTATVAGEYTVEYQVEDGVRRKSKEVKFTARRTTIHEASYVDINIDQTEFSSYYTNTTGSTKTLTISVLGVTNPSKKSVMKKSSGMETFTATVYPRPQIQFK